MALTPVKFGISFTLTHLNQAGALVHVYQRRLASISITAAPKWARGCFSKVAQVAAEELGIGLDRVHITATSTDKVPNTSATAASSGTDLNGMAVQLAAREIKARLIAVRRARPGTSPRTIFRSATTACSSATKAFCSAN